MVALSARSVQALGVAYEGIHPRGAAAAIAQNRFRLGFWLEERQRRTARTQLLRVHSVAAIKSRVGDESRDCWRGKLNFRRLQAGEGRDWDRRWVWTVVSRSVKSCFAGRSLTMVQTGPQAAGLDGGKLDGGQKRI